MPLVEVDPRVCVRCAACSTIAPTLFAVSRKGSRVTRQPTDEAEHRACRAAMFACPTQAIGGTP